VSVLRAQWAALVARHTSVRHLVSRQVMANISFVTNSAAFSHANHSHFAPFLDKQCFYYYYYLFSAIGFAPGGSGPYTTQLQQKTYNKNKYIP
jgi:hypothetical protein